MTAAVRPIGRGFTLIELVVAMGIAALLATIAIASYSAYVVRGKRAAAKTALLQDAQFMERNYTVAGCYTNTQGGCTGAAITNALLPVQTAPSDLPPGAASYNVTIAFPAPGGPAQSYVLTAAPTFNDPACGSLTLDYTGARNATGTDPTPVVTCWQR